MDKKYSFDSFISQAIEEKKKQGFILLTDLAPETKIEVVTKHSTYYIEVVKGQQIKIKGGKFIEDFTDALYAGATFGSAMIWLNRIANNMHMEIMVQFPEGRKKLVTSPVVAAKLIGKDWEYDMDWIVT